MSYRFISDKINWRIFFTLLLDLFTNNGHTSSIQPPIACSNALKPLVYTWFSAKHTPHAYSILLQMSPILAHLDYFQSQWLDRHNTILKSQHAPSTLTSIQSLTRSYHPKSKPKEWYNIYNRYQQNSVMHWDNTTSPQTCLTWSLSSITRL